MRKNTFSMTVFQSGLSLVELMVAVTIGLILLTGVLQIYSGSKQTYRIQDALSRLQENGRIAIEMLQRDIRPAGFMGCRKMNFAIDPVAVLPDARKISPDTAIIGYEGVGVPSAPGWQPSLPETLRKARFRSDILSIQHGDGCAVMLAQNLPVATGSVRIDAKNSCGFNAGDVLLVSDCNSKDIFRVQHIRPGGQNSQVMSIAAGANHHAYRTDAELMRFRHFSYFVAPDANGHPALWRLDQTKAVSDKAPANPQQVVAGIADMQIEYGEDTNQDNVPDYYVTADRIQHWGRVISIRLSLLARTREDNLLANPQQYTLGRKTVTAKDRRIYRVYTTSVLLRNRFHQ